MHGAVGLWIAIGLVFLAATGLTWSKYAGENVTDLRTSLGWTTPSVAKTLSGTDAAPSGGHEGHGGHASAPAGTDVLDGNVGRIDDVLAVAANAGVTGEVEASIPATPETAFVVTQTRQPWQFSTDAVAVDGATGQITDESRFADWPLAAKLTTWGIALHMGILFGLSNQIVLLALAIALVAVIVLGYRMWWLRRPRAARSAGVGRRPAAHCGPASRRDRRDCDRFRTGRMVRAAAGADAARVRCRRYGRRCVSAQTSIERHERMSDDLSLLRRELASIEAKVAREVDPRGRGPFIAATVLILLIALAAPQVDGLRAWQVLAGGHDEVAALPGCSRGSWWCSGSGCRRSRRGQRWVFAWVGGRDGRGTVGTALGLLTYWSQHSVRSAETGSLGYGLLVEWAAMAFLAALWIPVVAGRSNLMQR